MSDRTTKKPENLDSKGFPVSVCDKIRTRDLLVRSQTLYPAELRAHKRFSQTQVLYYRREGQMSSINLKFFIPDVYRLCHLSKMCRTLRRRIHTWIPIEG